MVARRLHRTPERALFALLLIHTIEISQGWSSSVSGRRIARGWTCPSPSSPHDHGWPSSNPLRSCFVQGSRQTCKRPYCVLLYASVNEDRGNENAVEDTTDPYIYELSATSDDVASLQAGIMEGFFIVKQYPNCALNGVFEWSNLLEHTLKPAHVARLGLTPTNVTVPIALMMADPSEFPTLSRARKACRKGNVLIRRRNSGQEEGAPQPQFVGRVGDRVHPNDTLFQQVRMGQGYFPVVGHKQPPFELPIIYEDDHCALVNKPAGVVVYRQGSSSSSFSGQQQEYCGGLMSIRAALPFVLTPPQRGTYSVLRRPASVHRLDKPTSGLLCIVKTKPAMLSLSKQFHDRIVQKTYMAIVNGIPQECHDATISSEEAAQLGVDIDPLQYKKATKWQLIDSPLDGKNALTVWRAVRYVPSLHALDGYLTLVELKPKTGRYHQLRRHMAWHCNRPIVGDAEYDGGTEQARKFRNNGLFLCASGVSFQHPYFNSIGGRSDWDALRDDDVKYANGLIWLSEEDDTVMVTAQLELPKKFESLLNREEERFSKFDGTKVSC